MSLMDHSPESIAYYIYNLLRKGDYNNVIDNVVVTENSIEFRLNNYSEDFLDEHDDIVFRKESKRRFLRLEPMDAAGLDYVLEYYKTLDKMSKEDPGRYSQDELSEISEELSNFYIIVPSLKGTDFPDIETHLLVLHYNAERAKNMDQVEGGK